jgi:hypothetical protein
VAVLSLLAVDGLLNDVVVQGCRSRLRVEFWYPVLGISRMHAMRGFAQGLCGPVFFVKHTLHLKVAKLMQQ